MKRMPTKKSHSWWWDSHISPKNSRWLSENLEQMDRLVKEMLKLIEEDGDSFAKKAEMYYKRRPELVKHVEEFYRMYRALAERYDIVTGELRNNIQLQTQGSGSGSDFGIEPPSPGQTPKDSGSDSDDVQESSSEPNPNPHVIELEDELREARERIQEYEKRLNDLENTTTSASIDQPHVSNGPSDINGEMRHLKEAMEAAAKQYESEISSKDRRIDEYKTRLDGAQEKLMTSYVYEPNTSLDGFKLKVDVPTSEKDELLASATEEHVHRLHLEHTKLIGEVEDARKGSVELRSRVRELEEEVEKQRVVILDGEEGKREAIRQLCFSLEHYRDGYKEMRLVLQGMHKGSTILAT